MINYVWLWCVHGGRHRVKHNASSKRQQLGILDSDNDEDEDDDEDNDDDDNEYNDDDDENDDNQNDDGDDDDDDGRSTLEDLPRALNFDPH